jgi:hypothetical protein
VEAAVTGGMHDIREEGGELSRCKVRKGTHGIWVVVPVIRMIVERLIPKPLHGHPVQRGKVSIYLLKKNLLRPWGGTARIKLFGPVRVLDESTETRSILIPALNGQLICSQSEMGKVNLRTNCTSPSIHQDRTRPTHSWGVPPLDTAYPYSSSLHAGLYQPVPTNAT